MEALQNNISSENYHEDQKTLHTSYTNKKKSKKFINPEMVDSALYDDAMLDVYLDGIAQNIQIEMDKQGMSLRKLSDLTGINASHICRILSHKSNIGLVALIKISCALQVGVNQLLPNDNNRRKTNGERFDDITKVLDVGSTNFLLGFAADFVRNWTRIRNTTQK